MGFEIPEDVKALDDDALANALASAFSEGGELAAKSDDDLSDEEFSRLTALGEFVTAAKTEQAERQSAAEEKAEALSAARNAFTASEDEESDEGSDEDEGEGTEDEESEDKGGEEFAAEDEGDKPADTDEEPEVAEASSKTKSFTSKVAGNKQKTKKVRPAATIVASADVPGFAAGQELTGIRQAGEAVKARLNGMPRGGKGKSRASAALIRKPVQFSQDDFRDDEALLLAAAREDRLDGGSLVAAGGWGAPSETLYDLPEFLATAEGIVDIPEVTVTRGGMKYTKGISFADIVASTTGFWDMTEAEAEAGQEKTSLRPEAPEFDDLRLDAVGLMIEAGLLLRTAWPEVIDQYTTGALLAHQHKVGQKVLDAMRAYAGTAVSVAGGFGNALDVLHAIEVVIQGERQRYRMGLTGTLECVLPFWTKSVIRADLANRNGVEAYNVTDAQIESFFSLRGARVQFVYDANQELDLDTNGVATAYPTEVEALVYPAGTYVKGTSDVLTLDTVYDSVNLKNNDYVALFVEEGVLVANPQHNGHLVSIPFAANGRTGAADITTDLFVSGA